MNTTYFQVLKGNERYNVRHYCYAGEFRQVEGIIRFYPFALVAKTRQDAHHNNNPYADLLAIAAKADQGAIESARIELVKPTAKQISSVISARYRQKMTRERSGAKQVIEDLTSILAGKTLTRLNISQVVCDLVLYGDHPRTEAIADTWKYIKVFNALCDL